MQIYSKFNSLLNLRNRYLQLDLSIIVIVLLKLLESVILYVIDVRVLEDKNIKQMNKGFEMAFG